MTKYQQQIVFWIVMLLFTVLVITFVAHSINKNARDQIQQQEQQYP